MECKKIKTQVILKSKDTKRIVDLSKTLIQMALSKKHVSDVVVYCRKDKIISF